MCCKTMEVVCHCEINGIVGYCHFYLLQRKFIVRRRRAQQESRLDESDLRDARKEMARLIYIYIYIYCMSGGGLFMR